MSSSAAIKSQSGRGGWDAHGFGANMTIQLNKLSAMKKYKLANINFLNPATRKVIVGAHESFRDVIGLKPGGIYTKYELKEVLEHLSNSLYFEKIEFDAKTNPDGTVDLNVPYKEAVYPKKSFFRCLSVGMLPEEETIEVPDLNLLTFDEEHELMKKIDEQRQQRNERAGQCILPEQVQDDIEWNLRKQPFVRASSLSMIVSRIQKWYHDHGYGEARVVKLANLENRGGEIIFEVNEGDIANVGVRFVEKNGNTCKGNTDIKLIKRALSGELAVGRAFNQRAFDRACQNINNLNLFSYVNVDPLKDKATGAMSAEIMLREDPGLWSSMGLDLCGPNGRPKIDSMRPSATIGYRNIKGLDRSLEGCITLGNLLKPEEANYIDYNIEYTHPYLDGIDNPRNRTFRASNFSTRKFCPVFGRQDDAPTFVDRLGIKATITEDYTKQSKFTYGLVLEDIKTRDGKGYVVSRGNRDGPPTTLSGTGNDRLALLQANLTLDSTRFVNGALVGARDVIQVDQGIGIGTKFALFSRAKVSSTGFIPLMKVKEGEGNAAPPTLVLHGVFGHSVGNLPNYEAFAIGGPQSVRGYNVGEIGASRSKLEMAAEVRIPVKNATVYGFAEHGNDLGSSVGLAGNPTESYMRRGRGSSYGLGIEFLGVRAEYAVDHNKRKGAFLFNFGHNF